MAFRGGVLVILCGLIPLAAAFSNVPTGERWLRRISGWIVALALYKLAAAFCYAAAFRLSAGTDVIAVMDGLALLVVSVLALPVLLRLTLPAAEHFALHRGAAASTIMAIGTIPTGAISLAAAGGGAGAMMAAGAGEQRFASTAGRAGEPGGGPSGAGAVDGEDNQRAGSGHGGGDPGGSAGGRVPSGAAKAQGSDGAGTGPSRPANPPGAEGGSPGGGVARGTSTSFAVPGRGGSPDRGVGGAAGGSASASRAPEAGAPAEGGSVEGSGVDYEHPGLASPGGSAAPRRPESGPSEPPNPSSGDDRTGTDDTWPGD
jgi:hypothetical protein